LAFEGRRVAVPAIARELGVDAVLEGSVRNQDGRLKISIQLIHAPTDAHLWAGEFEGPASDLPRLERDVARDVAEQVRVQMTPDERARLGAVPAVDAKAHEEYLLGRHLLWKFIEEDRERAIQHFRQAIAIDPEYPAPYAGLAHAWWMRGVFGPLSLNEVAGPARNAALEALARDDRFAEAHSALAYVQGMLDWDWARAEATIRRAVELEPNSVDAHYVHALLLMAMGRLSESITQIERAARLDPLSAQVQSTFGRILYRARRPLEAIERLHRAIELEPRNGGTATRLADVYAQMGRYAEALHAYDRARALGQADGVDGVRIARTYALMGRADDARRLLASSRRSGRSAAVHAALGDVDLAFKLLLRSVEEREDWFLFIKADPDFDVLHADPRWHDILRRMRLDS
jgi:tetratricopeptide (TPR) repeat protein